jgi:hypothetical protein
MATLRALGEKKLVDRFPLPNWIRESIRLYFLNRGLRKSERYYSQQIGQALRENLNERAEELRDERDFMGSEYGEEALQIESGRLVRRARKVRVYEDDLANTPSLSHLGNGTANYWVEGRFGHQYLQHSVLRELERLVSKAESERRKARRESITSWAGLFFGLLGIALTYYNVVVVSRESRQAIKAIKDEQDSQARLISDMQTKLLKGEKDTSGEVLKAKVPKFRKDVIGKAIKYKSDSRR